LRHGKTLGDEIRQQIRNKTFTPNTLSKEDKRLSGETVGPFGYEYDTGLMLDQIIERNGDKWQRELAVLETMEERDDYYRRVIYPHIQYLEKRIEERHRKYKDGTSNVFDEDGNTGIEPPNAQNDDNDDVIHERSHLCLHELVTDPSLCLILKNLTDEQKYILYHSAISDFTIGEIARMKGTTDRNVLKTLDTALRHVRGRYLPVVMLKHKIQTLAKYRWLFERGISTTFWERLFAATLGEEYADYYAEIAFDFVEIIKEYRAQHQRDLDWVAAWNERKRRRKKNDDAHLKSPASRGKITEDDISYDYEVTDDDAQDFSEQ
jgi:hypothetical protein